MPAVGFLNYDARRFFLLGMRFCFGLWLLYAGLFKWFVMGGAGFATAITADFDKTWSPHALNVALAWLIYIAEPVLSLFLLSGLKPRLAWALLTALMFLLTIGQSILMKGSVGDNWFYVVLALTCAALSDPDGQPQEAKANMEVKANV